MTLNTRRASGLAALALTMSLGLAGCSEEEPTATDPPEDTPSQTQEDTPSEEPEETEDAGAEAFGPGCAEVPADGDGSFNGMATAPVASAASANPLLQTLVAAVTEADLVDALNDAEALTVFAPAEPAFAKIPKADLQALLADKKLLTQVLTHHVVPEQLAPDQLAGKHETLNGDMITVKGSGEEFMVGDTEKAAVLCGNIPTANATVYVIDTVQMP